jgi:hypothetical protein
MLSTLLPASANIVMPKTIPAMVTTPPVAPNARRRSHEAAQRVQVSRYRRHVGLQSRHSGAHVFGGRTDLAQSGGAALQAAGQPAHRCGHRRERRVELGDAAEPLGDGVDQVVELATDDAAKLKHANATAIVSADPTITRATPR